MLGFNYVINILNNTKYGTTVTGCLSVLPTKDYPFIALLLGSSKKQVWLMPYLFENTLPLDRSSTRNEHEYHNY